MPPKRKYTKEEIVEIAFSLVREKGEAALSARTLAGALHTSTAPIFTEFSSVEEVYIAVIERAKMLYRQYIEKGLSQPIPFKGAGRAYISFAKEEPMLFRMLFMRTDDARATTHYMPSGDDNEGAVRVSLKSYWKMNDDDSKSLYNHMSVYCHGIAVLFAQGSRIFSDEDVDAMLSEAFYAFKERRERAKNAGERNLI